MKITKKGYPRGYKASIDAYMSGFTRSPFKYEKAKEEAIELLNIYNKIIKEDWELAKETAVEALIAIETDVKKMELLYGKEAEITETFEAKRSVLYFICWSLPKIEIKEGETNGK